MKKAHEYRQRVPRAGAQGAIGGRTPTASDDGGHLGYPRGGTRAAARRRAAGQWLEQLAPDPSRKHSPPGSAGLSFFVAFAVREIERTPAKFVVNPTFARKLHG